MQLCIIFRTVDRKFSIWGLCVCAGGLDIVKIDKNSTDYSVSCFNSGGLGALFGGISPQKPPVATGLIIFLYVALSIKGTRAPNSN